MLVAIYLLAALIVLFVVTLGFIFGGLIGYRFGVRRRHVQAQSGEPHASTLENGRVTPPPPPPPMIRCVPATSGDMHRGEMTLNSASDERMAPVNYGGGEASNTNEELLSRVQRTRQQYTRVK